MLLYMRAVGLEKITGIDRGTYLKKSRSSRRGVENSGLFFHISYLFFIVFSTYFFHIFHIFLHISHIFFNIFRILFLHISYLFLYIFTYFFIFSTYLSFPIHGPWDLEKFRTFHRGKGGRRKF